MQPSSQCAHSILLQHLSWLFAVCAPQGHMAMYSLIIKNLKNNFRYLNRRISCDKTMSVLGIFLSGFRRAASKDEIGVQLHQRSSLSTNQGTERGGCPRGPVNGRRRRAIMCTLQSCLNFKHPDSSLFVYEVEFMSEGLNYMLPLLHSSYYPCAFIILSLSFSFFKLTSAEMLT